MLCCWALSKPTNPVFLELVPEKTEQVLPLKGWTDVWNLRNLYHDVYLPIFFSSAESSLNGRSLSVRLSELLLQKRGNSKTSATCDAFGDGVGKKMAVKPVSIAIFVEYPLEHGLESFLEELLYEHGLKLLADGGRLLLFGSCFEWAISMSMEESMPTYCFPMPLVSILKLVDDELCLQSPRVFY